jgi:hypothetical protein
MDFKNLASPFPAEDIEWRAGSTNSDKTKAMALAYITSRAVMNRLDDVAGPENWQDMYTPAPSGGVMCGISIHIGDAWVTKWDVGENTDFEAIKGGFSDAFKRSAVKWGIGRYLYDVPAPWVECEQRGKSVVLKTTPKLPEWALPPKEKEITKKLPAQPAKVEQPATVTPPAQAPAHLYEVPAVSLEMAETMTTNDKPPRLYKDIDKGILNNMANTIENKLLAHKYADGNEKDLFEMKLGAIRTLLAAKGA